LGGARADREDRRSRRPGFPLPERLDALRPATTTEETRPDSVDHRADRSWGLRPPVTQLLPRRTRLARWPHALLSPELRPDNRPPQVARTRRRRCPAKYPTRARVPARTASDFRLPSDHHESLVVLRARARCAGLCQARAAGRRQHLKWSRNPAPNWISVADHACVRLPSCALGRTMRSTMSGITHGSD